MTLEIEMQFSEEFSGLPAVSELKKFLLSAYLTPEKSAAVGVRIVAEPESQQYNKQFRGKNKPTNVLAFPCHDIDDYLGDLLICAPIVNKEAIQQGKPEVAHWAHLLIHGMLHLQGYDHIESEQRKVMENLEIQILKQFNFPNPYEEEKLS